MTRFARAKGSKSSNLKAPEDSTPWEVMKEQMEKAKHENEESKKREEAEQQRIENYNNFLKEHKVQKRKANWCEFPESIKKPNLIETQPQKLKKDKNKSTSTERVSDGSENNISKNNTVTTSKVNDTVTKKKKKKNIKQVIQENNEDENKNSYENPENNEETHKQKKKNKKKKAPETKVNDKFNNENEKSANNQQTSANKRKPKLQKGEKAIRRKPIDDKSFQIIINGKEVELIRYNGFPVMKKDAERLDDLKQNMIKKGIPKSEVQRTMKLERRRAEKALARVRREVCYNCRKGGHNLSDCPDLKSHIPGVDTAEGVCFKCGSTEHRQFECKVQKDKEFRFATCFICKEPGHIARQCPDNPKGLYPNGGGCKLCGDVTHLRKDCHTLNEKKESTSIKLQTLNNNNIEDIDNQIKPVSAEVTKKPKKIRF